MQAVAAAVWVSMEYEMAQDVSALLQDRVKDLMVHWGVAAAAIMDTSLAGAGAAREEAKRAVAVRMMLWSCMVELLALLNLG